MCVKCRHGRGFLLIPMKRYTVLLALLFLLSDLAFGQTSSAKAPAWQVQAAEKTNLDHARVSIEVLNRRWLLRNGPAVSWSGIYAWQRFVIADSLMQYVNLSGDRTLLPLIEQAVANKDGLDGNDDDLWAVIASLNLYRLNHDSALLQYAQAKYRQLTDGYWDDTCGGGIWWNHARTYKNAITNELLLYAATLLFQTTDDPSYSAWATKIWDWFDRSGMINGNALINDGLTDKCRNNGQTTYTYNQGVILGGLANLYRIDHDKRHVELAVKIARATISGLADKDGILTEPVKDLSQDGQIFKGIFVLHLGNLSSLIEDKDDKKIFGSFLDANANSAWNNRRRPDDAINAYWSGASSVYGAAAQSAAINLFNSAANFSARNIP